MRSKKLVFSVLGVLHLNIILWLQDVEGSSANIGTKSESICAIILNVFSTTGLFVTFWFPLESLT